MRRQIVEMPPAIREQLGRLLLEYRNARLRGERVAVEARVKNMLPPAQPPNPEEDGASQQARAVEVIRVVVSRSGTLGLVVR